jgi:hypothetical protein
VSEDLVSVRYMVDDVREAIDFYTRQFGFELRMSALPAFADVIRGRLRILLAGPQSSAGRPMPDGRKPGQQILLEDPSGNPIELFQPAER